MTFAFPVVLILLIWPFKPKTLVQVADSINMKYVDALSVQLAEFELPLNLCFTTSRGFRGSCFSCITQAKRATSKLALGI